MGGSLKSDYACDACAVRSNGMVCRAAGIDSSAFQRIIHRFVYQPRQIVFYEGHPCLGLYVLRSGKAKLTSSSSTGHRRIMSIVGSGELIERTGFCEGMLHNVTCETLEPSRVCLIDRRGYLDLLERCPSLAVDLLQRMSREGLPSNEVPNSLPFCKTADRLAAVLLELGRRFGHREPAGIALDIRLTREELSELACMAPETTIRLLARFKRERLISTNGRDILLLKPDRLGKLAARLS
jgi:CRP/FNR family transcriptional regulator